MVSLLEKALKQKVAKAFKGKLTKGNLWRETTVAVNSFGDETAVTPVAYPFEGIRESFSASFAVRAGIPLTDVSILVLLGSIAVTPKQHDELFLKKPWNKRYKVRAVLAVDPAGATMQLQCYEIPGTS